MGLTNYLRGMLVCALVAHGAAAQSVGLTRIGVLDLTSEDVSGPELSMLSDRLRAELFQTGEYTVIERDQMAAILEEQGFQQSGCVATDCVVEVGQLAGAEKMVGGTVGRIGSVYSISLRIIDVATGAIEETAVKDCRCTLEDILTTTIAQVAAELAGVEPMQTTEFQRGEGMGMLFVESTPPGATIALDGRLRREVTPATFQRLPVGEHLVRLVKGNLVAKQRVTIARDRLVKVTLALRLGSGSMFIQSAPSGAPVKVDGRTRGTTPVLISDLAVGSHVVRVTAPNRAPWQERVRVDLNDRAAVMARLEPCGYLSISVQPAGAIVHVDGASIGTETVSRRPIGVGSHLVVAKLADHDSLSRDVVIRLGQETFLSGDLPLLPQVARVRKARIRWVSLAVAAVAAGIGYRMNMDAKAAYDERMTVYREYQVEKDRPEVARLRGEIDAAAARGDAAASKRNIFYGIASAALSIGILLPLTF